MLYRTRSANVEKVAASTPMLALPEVLIGTFLALVAGFFVFSYSSTAALQVHDRSIGISVMQGVDASRRARIYLLMVSVSLGVGLACYHAARALRGRAPSWFAGVRSCLENDLCAMFCALGSVALTSRVAGDRLDGLARVQLAAAGAAAVFGIALIRRLSSAGPRGRLLRQLTTWSVTVPLALLLWPSLQIGAIAQSISQSPSPWPMRLGVALLPTVYLVGQSYSIYRRSQRPPTQVRRAFLIGSAPFLLFPSLCPLANELQYALLPAHAFTPVRVALTLLAGLALVAAVLFTRVYQGKLRVSPGRLLARFCFPIVVFGATTVMFHQNGLNVRQWDPLHDGEQITAIHQLLQFDKWPFVEVWPAHGLYDYFGVLYAKLNGFKPFELTAWNVVPAALSSAAVYAILASVSTPIFAFAVAMTLPIDAIFPFPTYSFFCADPALLGVGLLVIWTLERRSTFRYIVLALASCLCFAWTPASGIAGGAAAFGLLVLDCLTAGDRRAARRGLGVFATTLGCLFAAYIAILLVRRHEVFETLRLVLAYIRADPMLGARSTIIRQFDSLAFLQYVLLPGIGLLFLAKLARHAIERRPLGRVELVLGFLTLASFVLFVRALARHSLEETYQPFFFPFLALTAFMPGSINRGLAMPEASRDLPSGGGVALRLAHSALGRAWFCAGLALHMVAFPGRSRLLDPLATFTLREWKANEARYPGPVSFYPELRAFLDEALRPSDTFLELLNMPLLYTYFERELPGQFFFATFFYGSDDVQHTFLKRFDAFGGAERVPVVLLSSPDGTVNVDGVSNTLRSYRIAERIYRDYVPFGTIDKFEIWVSRKLWATARNKAKPVPLPFAERSTWQTRSIDAATRDGDAVRLTSRGPDPQLDNAVKLDGITLGDVNSPHALRFLYRTDVPGTVEVFYRYGGDGYHAAHSAGLWVRPSQSGDWQMAELAVPLQAKHGLPLNGVRIDPPDNSQFDIKSLELVFGNPPSRGAEGTYLGMLPFVWGNFDASLANTTGTVLELLSLPSSKDEPLSTELIVRRQPDKSTGNYLRLCLRLPPAAIARTPTERASWKSVKHGDNWQSAGRVKLTYGVPHSQFEFDLVRPDPAAPGLRSALVDSFRTDCKVYLVRLSLQYAWSTQKVSKLRLQSSTVVEIESAELLAGD